jgi:hypothetical protein
MLCPYHPPLLDRSNYTRIWRIVKVRSSSLFSFLQPPLTPSPFDANILLSALLSVTIYVPPLMSETKFHTHTRTEPQEIL